MKIRTFPKRYERLQPLDFWDTMYDLHGPGLRELNQTIIQAAKFKIEVNNFTLMHQEFLKELSSRSFFCSTKS